MAPSFFSCEGRGTSRRVPPVTGNRPGSEVGVGSTDVADLVAEEDMLAIGAARRRKGVVCAAVMGVSSSCGEQCGEVLLPRSARGATDLESDIILSMLSLKKGRDRLEEGV